MDAKDKKIATDLAYEIIKEVSRAIRPYAGTPEAGAEHQGCDLSLARTLCQLPGGLLCAGGPPHGRGAQTRL